MASKLTAQETWNKLNDRQKNALTAIYHSDQKAEKDEAARWRMGWERRPASVWRNLRYPDLNGHETYLHRQLREAEVIDAGLGSTLAALGRRKLVECSYYQALGSDELLSVKLTNLGRAVARAGLGESAPKRQPKGQLKEGQWAALVAAWVAGDEGVKAGIVSSNYGGFSWQWTWLRLRDYYGTGNGLVEERSRLITVRPRWEEPFSKRVYDIVITPAGREFYEENWQHYRELYPDIDAPEPHA